MLVTPANTMAIFIGINHNVDELLVGVLTQIRLRRKLDKKRLDNQNTSMVKL